MSKNSWLAHRSESASSALTPCAPRLRKSRPLRDPITLYENKSSDPVELSLAERDALQSAAPSIAITPARGSEHQFVLTPSSHVGAISVGELVIEIRPKIK